MTCLTKYMTLTYKKATPRLIRSPTVFSQSVNGPKAELDSTVISQPAIFVASMACVEQLRATNPAAVESCTVAMGLSLGEYSALCFAGAISFEDGVRLTKARGEAMQAASDTVPSSMVAISGLDALKVQEICDAAARETGRPLCIANYLAEGSYAVSGAKEACLAAIEIATVMGARQVVQLAVAGAFHTAFMQPAVLPLQEALRHVTVSSPRIPVIANVDGKAHFYPQDIRDSLVRQVTSPVQWETTIGTMVRSPDFVKAYELGPGTVCKALVKRFGRRIDVTSVSP